MSLNEVDVDEMFLQMSEKLGWLQLGDVDSAISSLTKKQKPKKSVKKSSTTKKISASSKKSTTADPATTTTSSSSTSSKVKKPKSTTKKLGVSGKSDGDCDNDASKVASNHGKNMKQDLVDETLGKICVGLKSQHKKDLECPDSPGLTVSSTGHNDINGGCPDYDVEIGKDKTSLVSSVFSQPPEAHSQSRQHGDNSNRNSLKSQSDSSLFEDSVSMSSICKKISFASDDSITERSLNNSDSASNTSNSRNAVEKFPLATTIETPSAVAESVKMEIPSTAVSVAGSSLGTPSTPRNIKGPCSPRSSIQRSCTNRYFSKEDGSGEDTGGFCNNKETRQRMPPSTDKTQMSSFSVEEFFISDDDDDDCIIDCDDDILQDYTPSPPNHRLLLDVKSEKTALSNSDRSAMTPLTAFNGRRCQSEFRPHKPTSNNNTTTTDDNQWKRRNLSTVSLSSDGSDVSNNDDDSDDDDTFEAFLTKMKTPARKKPIASPESMDAFIVSDSESSSGNSDSDDKYSVSLYHRTRPISPDISSFKRTFDNNPPSSVRKENPNQSKTHEKRSNGSIKPIKDTRPKPKTQTGKPSVGGGDDGVFRKPSVFTSINTNPSTGSKSTVTGFKTPVFNKRPTPVNNVPPNVPHGGKVPQTCPTLKYLHQPTPSSLPHQANKQREGDGYTAFLKSLSENTENLSYVNEEARKFVKYFKQFRLQLVKKLFAIYNETIFENRFPPDFSIVWNKRLLTTAGRCKLKKKTNVACKTQVLRTAEINLATKVCDTAERVRDTLIHELCHAAVWLFNGSHEGHGKLWKSWARRANRRFPSSLPIIERCHSYKISKKFTYKCVRCGYSFGRHSKSLDTEKKVCGYCHGRFVLVTTVDPTHDSKKGVSATTPARTPNKFALFVKEHYGTVKKTNSCSHRDVMNILSQKFKEAQIC